MLWSELQLVHVTEEIVVEVEVNGMKVQEKRAVTVIKTATVTKSAELKTLKATDTNGKAIDADKLAELLKDKTPVVLLPGPMPEKHRGLFKDKTVFIELPALTPAPLPPVPAPVPLPPVVEPKKQ